MLTGVTLTGADDRTSKSDLIALSEEFPFVEWGVLIGVGTGPRFPSREWIEDFAREARTRCRLSLHVCDSDLYSILDNGQFDYSNSEAFGSFQRMQLNFHAHPVTDTQSDNLLRVLESLGSRAPEIIVQLDGVNDWILHRLLAKRIVASGLYDESHGAGVKPKNWPVPRPSWEVGYAGGIGPESIDNDLAAIIVVTNDHPFWIDMETKLRSHSGGHSVFDLEKCRRVLSSKAVNCALKGES